MCLDCEHSGLECEQVNYLYSFYLVPYMLLLRTLMTATTTATMMITMMTIVFMWIFINRSLSTSWIVYGVLF